MALLPFSLKVYLVRLWLYVALLLFSVILLGLSAQRLRYTVHLPTYDPLNKGKPFYDPIVAELFATSVFTFFWSLHMVHTISRSVERGGFFVRIFFELLFLGILWVLYLVGAAVATSIWPNLSFCWTYKECKILTALVVFSWIGWITLFVLTGTTLLFAFTRNAWKKHSHARWRYEEPEAYRTEKA